jgi:hypothetical protein
MSHDFGDHDPSHNAVYVDGHAGREPTAVIAQL